MVWYCQAWHPQGAVTIWWRLVLYTSRFIFTDVWHVIWFWFISIKLMCAANGDCRDNLFMWHDILARISCQSSPMQYICVRVPHYGIIAQCFIRFFHKAAFLASGSSITNEVRSSTALWVQVIRGLPAFLADCQLELISCCRLRMPVVKPWQWVLIRTCCCFSICCTSPLHQVAVWRERSRQDLRRSTEQWNLPFTLLWWLKLCC